jgi:hypothetical protein
MPNEAFKPGKPIEKRNILKNRRSQDRYEKASRAPILVTEGKGGKLCFSSV